MFVAVEQHSQHLARHGSGTPDIGLTLAFWSSSMMAFSLRSSTTLGEMMTLMTHCWLHLWRSSGRSLTVMSSNRTPCSRQRRRLTFTQEVRGKKSGSQEDMGEGGIQNVRKQESQEVRK